MELVLPMSYCELEQEEMMYVEGGNIFYSRKEFWWGVEVLYTKAKASTLARDLGRVAVFGGALSTIAGAAGIVLGVFTATLAWFVNDLNYAVSRATHSVKVNYGYLWFPDVYAL